MPCSKFVSMALSQKGLENFGNDSFPIFNIHLDSTFNQAMEKMIATHVHRLWCTDPHLKIIGVLSQTDLINSFVKILIDPMRKQDEDKLANSFNNDDD